MLPAGFEALAERIRRLLALDPAAPGALREADRLADGALVAALLLLFSDHGFRHRATTATVPATHTAARPLTR